MSILLLILKRIVLSAVLIVVGVYILRYTAKIISWFGLQDFAEDFVGSGGTATMWKVIGVLCVVGGILALGGMFSFLGF